MKDVVLFVLLRSGHGRVARCPARSLRPPDSGSEQALLSKTAAWRSANEKQRTRAGPSARYAIAITATCIVTVRRRFAMVSVSCARR